ncbi:MAG: hypothetical protein HOK14_06260 [Gammaproteobacteria bacterium]|nr:hypothetical protein [Gammaproteobacteria bacterium]MBT7436662.1 hypothetical protein [Gammaproteobacteria bacterium]
MNEMINNATPTVQSVSCIPARMTSNELSSSLAQCRGSELWYRHNINRAMLYTDGVKYFADEAGGQGAYWFIDLIAVKYFSLLHKSAFLHIKLNVSHDNKASISIDDGNDNVLAAAKIKFTDVQKGEWRFYLTDNTLLLPSEY